MADIGFRVWGVYRGLYGDNEKEDGSYYIFMRYILGIYIYIGLPFWLWQLRRPFLDFMGLGLGFERLPGFRL